MRVVVVGLGVQGYKRRAVAGADFVASVDPVNSEADFRRLDEVPVESYDAVLACIPDAPKILLHNVYGWFDRTERGVYALTDAGRAALKRWPQNSSSEIAAAEST